MNFINQNIVTIVTFLPLAGALLLLVFPRRDRDIRYFALGISLVTLLASLHLPWHFQRGADGFQYEQNVPWIPHPNIHYHLGVDGISLWLVVLTTFLMPLCVLVSWKSINERVKEFFILMLVLETAMIGVFVSLDLFLFYFFWEATLIPMALHHRHVRARPQDLRGGEVLPVHHDRLGVHAGRTPVALRPHRQLRLPGNSACDCSREQFRDLPARRSGCSWDSSSPLR